MSKRLFARWTSAAEGTGMEIVRVHVLHDEPDLDGCECVHYVCGDVTGSFLRAAEADAAREERLHGMTCERCGGALMWHDEMTPAGWGRELKCVLCGRGVERRPWEEADRTRLGTRKLWKHTQ